MALGWPPQWESPVAGLWPLRLSLRTLWQEYQSELLQLSTAAMTRQTISP
jgi:hypothetical protein